MNQETLTMSLGPEVSFLFFLSTYFSLTNEVVLSVVTARLGSKAAAKAQL
jgi:hypothetical protein